MEVVSVSSLGYTPSSQKSILGFFHEPSSELGGLRKFSGKPHILGYPLNPISNPLKSSSDTHSNPHENPMKIPIHLWTPPIFIGFPIEKISHLFLDRHGETLGQA